MRASRKWRFVFAVLTVLAVLPASAMATQMSLAELLAGGELVSGDKKFHGFANYLQNGDLNIDAALVDVFAITTLMPDGTIEHGVRFQTPSGWELSGNNLAYDMSLDFLVTAIDPRKWITDNTLVITGNHVGGGEAHIVEGVVDFETGATLANKEVYINIGNTGVDKLLDHQEFVPPPTFPVPPGYRTVRIRKDFHLQTRDGGAQQDNIFVSHFEQTFSQVPEPSSVILMGLGGLLIVGRKIRARCIQRVE